MEKAQAINMEDYIYDLPDEKIAKYPLSDRGNSKLLLFKKGKLSHDFFNKLEDYLPKNSLLVFNDTKVIKARLEFLKLTGARIEIFCLEPSCPSDYASVFSSCEPVQWKCMIGNQKKWKEGALVKEVQLSKQVVKLKVEKIGTMPIPEVRFSWGDDSVSFGEIMEALGELPIPPYLNRKTEFSDYERYQTVYSQYKGSVAAPTAGLHFTSQVFDRLNLAGHGLTNVTLHVGAGTFKPVSSSDAREHQMHAEVFNVKKSTIKNLVERSGKIIPVGTTSARTVESLYCIANQVMNGKACEEFFVSQWEPYAYTANPQHCLESLLVYMEKNGLEAIRAKTQIMIVPGYKFKYTNALITNFHQPKSTLLLLISALLGKSWKEVYDYALKNDFYFLSYGDSSFLEP